MTKRQIIGAIMAATGETVEQLAAKHGYTKAAFYDVIKMRTKTPHLREIIAETTGKSVSELWPDNKAREAA